MRVFLFTISIAERTRDFFFIFVVLLLLLYIFKQILTHISRDLKINIDIHFRSYIVVIRTWCLFFFFLHVEIHKLISYSKYRAKIHGQLIL